MEHGLRASIAKSIFILDRTISAVAEVVEAFALGHGLEQAADGRPEFVSGSRGGRKSALSLANSCSIGLRSGE